MGNGESVGRTITVRWTRARLMAAAMAALTALCAAILGPSQPASAAAFVPITGAGSTWSYNAINDWTQDVSQFGMKINYQPVGSASGRQEFAGGTADWAASEIPYGVEDGSSPNLPPSRGFTYVPDTAGAVTFMYNLHIGGQQVTSLRLSGAVVAGIFTNKITQWNDPKIAADNPGLTLPAEAIVPVVRTDSSGSTWHFTQWMNSTQGSSWSTYCAVVGISPCAPTTGYPVQAGTSMVGQQGDLGVSGYVAQGAAEGAIGYTEYSYALEAGFPVAKVLNAAGYYTAPTPGHVGVSLLDAQIDQNPNDPLYQTADLSPVYTDPDPRTYELSYYSYAIVPTDLTPLMTTAKGDTLAAFGQYMLCRGQLSLGSLGYAPLPINLVEAGYAQLTRIPGASLPTSASAFIASCENPTFSADGTNTLASTDPMPSACDRQGGPLLCSTPVSTTTTLTASPNPAAVSQIVTLTATETAADGTIQAGSVQFEFGGLMVGNTDIGSPVPVNASGTATTTVTFDVTGELDVSAMFTPTDTTDYSPSTGGIRESVQLSGTAGAEPLFVSVPVTGSFSVTVAAGTINLAFSGSQATGELNTITVSDSRNTFPGWSVSGQEADFAGSGTASGSTIPGNQLGWVPLGFSSSGSGFILGAPVVPAGPGLGTTAAVLASAPTGSGFGTTTLSANLTLVPGEARPGDYTGALTVTAVAAPP